MEYIIAYYNEYGYTVCLCCDGNIITDIYSAGNNKNSDATTDSVSAYDCINCLPLAILKKHARKTGKEIARERRLKFLGVAYNEWNIDNILTDRIWMKSGGPYETETAKIR